VHDAKHELPQAIHGVYHKQDYQMREDLLKHFPEFPDLTLLPEAYPVLSGSELANTWKSMYASDGEVVAVDGTLGAIRLPNSPIQKILSVDLCEVVRRTHQAAAAALGRDLDTISNDVWNYRIGIPADKVPYLVTVLMNLGEVAPDPEIDDIRNELLAIRDEETLIIANTSTLPGCEKATIEFLAHYLPDCFDGIILPRNHDGQGQTTKAQALEALLSTIGRARGDLAELIHIDDAPHHTQAILKELSHIALHGACIMPIFEAGAKSISDPHALPIPDEAERVSSPLQAIRLARDLLSNKG